MEYNATTCTSFLFLVALYETHLVTAPLAMAMIFVNTTPRVGFSRSSSYSHRPCNDYHFVLLRE